MKDLTTINSEISTLEVEAATIKSDLASGKKILAAEANRLRKRYGAISKQVVFLKMIKRYLETQPTVEFLKKEEVRLKTRLELIDKEFFVKYGDKAEKITKEEKKLYYKEWDAPKLKTHLKNVRYLLN